jgi:hypothetical protein
MKKIFTLLLSSLFSLSLLAFDGSRLSITAPSTSTQLQVEIDGRKFTMKNNSITVGYLGEGRHNVVIYKEAKRKRSDFGRREIIYNSSVILKRGFHLDITVNRFGKVMMDERRIDHEDEWYNDEDEYYDNEGWDNSMNKMSVREFETLKESLRKEWFEHNRLKSVKYIIEKSNFSTAQVKDLMLLFTFENNRLEIAKAAFRKTIDKENYYIVNEALTFSSSKDELARFIRESR